jgi:hypothetical protein
MICGGAADLLQRCIRASRDCRRDDSVFQLRGVDQTLLEVDQPLIRTLDSDLHHAEGTALGDQAVHLGRGQVELVRDVRLLHTFDEVQNQDRVDLANQLEIFFFCGHVQIP